MSNTMKKEMDAHKEEVDEQHSEELSSNESSLYQAIDRISSLILLSYTIKVFPVKWQVIRNKVEELKSCLTAAEKCHPGEHVAFSKLVSAILVTVDDCHSLARRCIDFSYTGKLLMQSNLNAVSAKFEVHIKKLAGMYNAGILTHGCAIVVSRPSVGASRDDMQFYVSDLLTRMKAGGSEMKSQALMTLNEVMIDETYVTIVFEMDELITLLVSFIEFEVMDIQEKSLDVIMIITDIDSYKGVLVGAGIIAPLIHVLVSGSEYGKEQAARCMHKLTEKSDNAWSVSSHGGVPTLLNICTNSDSKPELICSVCGVLKSLSGVEEIRRFMVKEGAIPAFIRLLRSKHEMVQINAILFLQLMTSRDELSLQIFIKEGGIESLVCLLDLKTSFTAKAQKTALEAIKSICFPSKSSISILRGYKFLNKLLFLLQDSEFSLQESVLKAVLQLCGMSEAIMKEMGDAGFMSVLLTLLDAKCFDIREMAAEALSSMLTVTKNRKKFMEEDWNVSRVLQVLDPNDVKLSNVRYLLSCLMSITSCSSGRRKIAISCHLAKLEKLAEAEVMDAKNIVRKLSANRFQIMLDNIWNA